jgi:hypothetical protein
MRWPSASLAACSCALLLAGCGGGTKQTVTTSKPPRIPADLASRLASEADRIATLPTGSCDARDAAARFQADVVDSIGRVPTRYQEHLMSAANGLAERLATCEEPKHEKKKRDKHEKKREKH